MSEAADQANLDVSSADQSTGDWDRRPDPESQVDVSGGVHSAVEPFFVQATQVSYWKNVNLNTLGLRAKRYGCYSLGTPGQNPRGMGTWVTDNLNRYLLAVSGSQIYRSIGDMSWADVIGSAYSLAGADLVDLVTGRCLWVDASGVTLSRATLFAHTYEHASEATYAPILAIAEGGGITMNVSLCPRALTWWQGRLWAGNLSVPDFGPDTLIWSNIGNGLVFGMTNNIEVDARKGDEIVAIIPPRSSEPRLYIFKRNSIYAFDVVWGSGTVIPTTENSIDTSNSKLIAISTNRGCVAPKTIVYGSGSTKADIFFLSADGLRSLQRVEQDVAGGAGEPISKPIQDVIDRINWGFVQRAYANVHDNKLFLGLPLDGEEYPHTEFVFDLERKIWIGEYPLAGVSAVEWDLTGAASKMYLQCVHLTTETLAGTNATSGNHIFECFRSGCFYDASLTPVEFVESTRGFTFGNYGVKKRWSWLELLLQPATTTATISIYTKIDELDWALLTQVAITPDYEPPRLPQMLPWNFSQPKPQRLKLNMQDLVPGQQVQIKTVADCLSTFGVRAVRLTAWPYPESWE